MRLIGAVLVFVGLVCTGLLTGIFVVLVRLSRKRDTQHREAMERAAQLHGALCEQLTATSTTITERAHLIGTGLAAELRAMAAAHRNDLRLAMRLPPLHVPGEESQPAPATPRSSTPATPASSPASLVPSSTTRASVARPAARKVGNDDATPPSGWTLAEIRAHAAGPDLTDTEPRR